MLACVAAVLAVAAPAHGHAGTVAPLAPVTGADGRLGLCDVLPGTVPGSTTQTWSQLAFNAGARINRWEFRWDHLERQPGSWDFSSGDPAVAASLNAGLDVLGILIGTPGWAASPGQKPGNGVPTGLYLPYRDPGNSWAEYVRHTVAHYTGEVRYWEVWNEPDLPYFWSGSSEDYLRLLKVAYLTIKDVDPGARVLMAGMVVPDMSFFKRVLRDAVHDPAHAANHDFFDAVSWHAYGQAGALYGNLLRMRSMLDEIGDGSARLWVTEDGFPASNPNGEPRQAAYIEQTIAFALAAGANKILIYRESDDVLPKTWGVLSAAGVPRMGYVALQTMASLFSHVNAVLYAPTESLQRFVVYRRGRRMLMLWSRNVTGQEVPVSADSPAATAVDWQGQTTPLVAADGHFAISVPGADFNASVDPQSAVVGGPPRFIDQSNVLPTSLSDVSYLSQVDGARRQLVIFNPDPGPVSVDVAAAAEPVAHEVVQLPARATQSLDLDLVAGPNYAGPFRLGATHAVAAEGLSTTDVRRPTPASASWLLPIAPPILTFLNPSTNPAAVTAIAYGPRGRARFWKHIDLSPEGSATWSPPTSPSGPSLALAVQSDNPIVLQGINGQAVQAVPQAQTTWYLLHPASGSVSLFNPDSAASAQVDVRYVGSPNFTLAQLTLGARQSASVSPHGAAAVIVSASRPVAAGYSQSASSNAPPSTPMLRAAFAVGRTTTVRVLNPGPQLAHLTVSTLTAGGSQTRSLTVRAMKVVSFTESVPAALGQALILDSDVPLVSRAD